MSNFAHELINLGFSQIFELEYEDEESEGGYGSSHTWGTYVAKKGEQFERFTLHEYARFGFNAKRRVSISDEKVISEEEHAAATIGKEQIDTPERIRQVQEESEKLKLRIKAEHQLNGIDHKCPTCGAHMLWKGGNYGPFWGCSKYPNCKRTIQMSAAEKKLYQQHAGE